MIEEAAAGRQARVDRGEDVIVGVNKYRLASEDKLETLEVDNHVVREAQIARIKRVRETRDETKCRAALNALTEGAKTGGNLLELAVEAARHRATLGEISDAMEIVFGRHGTFPTPVKGVYGAAYAGDSRYQQVLDGVEAVTRRLGRKPRMLVAKMGQDGHDRGANVIASAFSDMGFDVTSGPLFQTPEEAAKLALENDVDAVGASSLAAGHKTLLPTLVNALKEQGSDDIIVFAGGVIPAQDYDTLYKAGAKAIFGPGTRIEDSARTVLTEIRKALAK